MIVLIIIAVFLAADLHAGWIKTTVQGDGTRTNPYRPVLEDSANKKLPVQGWSGIPVYSGQATPQGYCVWVSEDMTKFSLKSGLSHIKKGDPSCEFDNKIDLDFIERPIVKSRIDKIRDGIVRWTRWLMEPVSVWAASFSDNFNRSDNTELGANWTPFANNLQIVGNKVRGTTGYLSDFERYSATTPTDAQYAQVLVSTWTGANPCVAGLILRFDTGLNDFYILVARRNTGEQFEILHYNGSFNSLATSNPGAAAANDTLQATISGTNLALKKNGSSVVTVSDANLSSGQTGMTVGCETDLSGAELDDFVGGDLADLSAAARRRVIILP